MKPDRTTCEAFLADALEDYQGTRQRELNLSSPEAVIGEWLQFHQELGAAVLAVPPDQVPRVVRCGATLLAAICLRAFECLPRPPAAPKKGGPADAT